MIYSFCILVGQCLEKLWINHSYFNNESFIVTAAASATKSLQSCPTLCDPRTGSPPGSPVPGILQARTLEWVVISFSNAWKWKVKVKSLSRVRPSATPWTAAYHAPPSMVFSRQEYWSGVPLPSPNFSLNATYSESSPMFIQNKRPPLSCPLISIPCGTEIDSTCGYLTVPFSLFLH